jgi:excisionase family DNA binding protein
MDQLAVSVSEAGAVVGLSKHTIRAYVRSGRVRAVRFGRRVLIPVEEVQRIAREGIRPVRAAAR